MRRCQARGSPRRHWSQTGSPTFTSFRPAYIYPVEPREEPNSSYRLLRGIYPMFRLLFPNQVIRADDLARVMLDAAVRGTGEHRGPRFDNRDIQAWIHSILPAEKANLARCESVRPHNL